MTRSQTSTGRATALIDEWDRADQRARDLCLHGDLSKALAAVNHALRLASKLDDFRYPRSLQCLATIASKNGDEELRQSALAEALTWYRERHLLKSRDAAAAFLHLALIALEQDDAAAAETLTLAALGASNRAIQRQDPIRRALVLILAAALARAGREQLAMSVRASASPEVER